MNNQPTIDDIARILVNSKPITQKQIKELNRYKERPKFPYDEVANTLNNLPESQLLLIPDIIHNAELSVWKKVGIKKLYAMIKNPLVKKYMKHMYNL